MRDAANLAEAPESTEGNEPLAIYRDKAEDKLATDAPT